MLKIVEVPSIMEPITRSPGFAKKQLSDYKLDAIGLCQFGCAYCSSNHGNYLRINRDDFAELTEQQTGERTTPAQDPDLMFTWPDVVEKLETQLANKKPAWGEGETLVYSMLTDGFSPHLVSSGTTEKLLGIVLERTSFRIRVLTKNAIVGSRKWLKFFASYADRFVVGLSIGTTDDLWSRRVELKTSVPTARIRAMRNLQEAGVPTYGMLCPVFNEMLEGDALEKLLDAIRPDLIEHLWAEPYNDRQNWRHVREYLPANSASHRMLTAVYEEGRKELWSAYATELYLRIRQHAESNGWISKLRFLLYESLITADDARRFGDCAGVLLQATPDENGRSKNPAFSYVAIGQ